MIIIEKPATAENQALVSHHKVTRAEISPDGDAITLFVSSWPNEQARLTGADPIAYSASRILIQDLPTASKLLEDLGSVLTGQGWLSGGLAVNDKTTTIEIAKARKWMSIKAVRDRLEFSTFTWNGLVFNTDPTSQARIAGAVINAMAAKSLNQSYSVEWTLSDNTSYVLDIDNVIALGQALAAHVQALHAKSREIRAEIDNATTIEEVEAIQWQ